MVASEAMQIREKRRARRFSGRIGLVSADTDGLNFSFICDLCRDGAYIETEKLLPVGVKFEFMLSNGTMHAPVLSRVIRVRDAFYDGGKSGMGIEFSQMDHSARSLRDDLLLYLMGLRHHEMWEAA